MKKFISTLVVLLVLSVGINAAAVTLPNPTDVYDGLPAAILYDDFWSYNLWLLEDFATSGPVDLEPFAGEYKINGGVGNQDIVLYTQAGGTSNLGIGPGGTFNFEDPVDTNTGVADGARFDGWWGQNDQNNDGIVVDVNGPVTVGNLLDYLHAFDPLNNTPVFLFDVNQTGAQRDLLGYGQVTIIDDVTGAVVQSWAFDNTPQPGDGTMDPGSYVFVPGSYSFTGASGTVYEESYTGSGFDDYAFFAQTMNLSLFDPLDLFVVEFHFDWLNNGGEEFFLTGTFVPPPPPPVIPEPSTFILLALGLLGFIGIRYKKR